MRVRAEAREPRRSARSTARSGCSNAAAVGRISTSSDSARCSRWLSSAAARLGPLAAAEQRERTRRLLHRRLILRSVSHASAGLVGALARSGYPPVTSRRSTRGARGVGGAMTIKRIGIVGSGIMGSGIAEVAAKAGIEVVLRSRAQSTADAMVAGLEKSLAKQVERGKLEAGRARHGARPRARRHRPRRARRLRPRARVDRRGPRREEAPLHRARPHLRRARDPRDQHVDAAGGRDGDGDRPPRPGVRRPLLQPGADDGAGRGRARDHDLRRDDRRGDRVRRRRAARTRCW